MYSYKRGSHAGYYFDMNINSNRVYDGMNINSNRVYDANIIDPYKEYVNSFKSCKVDYSQPVAEEQKPKHWTELLLPIHDTIEEEDSDDSCVICFNHRKNVVMIPCGHAQFCITCSVGLYKPGEDMLCPICSENVDRVIRMYLK